MPYQAFHAAAVRARYDVDVLHSRFGVSFEQAANRLTMLQRPGASGVPFFMLEVDHAGHRFRKRRRARLSAGRFGGGCPKLPVHAAFAPARPDSRRGGRNARRRASSCASRARWKGRKARSPSARAAPRCCSAATSASRTRSSTARRFRQPCQARPTPGKAGPGAFAATPVGPACRLCERVGCLARAEPPVTRPLGLDEMVTGLSAFDFQ